MGAGLRRALVILSCIFFIGCVAICRAQLPRVCATVEPLLNRTCCPVPEGMTEACGGLGRGSCQYFHPSDDQIVPELYVGFETDDRVKWPSKYFDNLCKCEWPFWGYDCSECALGQTGDECEETNIVTRRNVLTDYTDMEKFGTYLNWAKGNTSKYVVETVWYAYMWSDNGTLTPSFRDVNVYDYFIWIHWMSQMKFSYLEDLTGEGSETVMAFAHRTANFPTWHRIFLVLVERAIQQLSGDLGFSIPFWDWAAEDGHGCAICNYDYVGLGAEGSGVIEDSKYFSNWRSYCESYIIDDLAYWLCDMADGGPIWRFKCDCHPFSNKKDVGDVLKIPFYDTPPFAVTNNCSFRNGLGGNQIPSTGVSYEGARYLHGAVHAGFNGTHQNLGSSVSDPLFLLHHAYTDWIFEKWMRRWDATEEAYPSQAIQPGSNRDAYLIGMIPLLDNADAFKKTFELGYDYENLDKHGNSLDDEEYGLTGDLSDMNECVYWIKDSLLHIPAKLQF